MICPRCGNPTFFSHQGEQILGVPFGNDIQGIDKAEIAALYMEARKATSVGAYTAAVLVCRKILMNVAVSFGAPENDKFVNYVNYLADKGFVPPNGKDWLEAIRNKGNDATHEIDVMNKGDAARIIHFTEMLLRFNFELKAMLAEDNKP